MRSAGSVSSRSAPPASGVRSARFPRAEPRRFHDGFDDAPDADRGELGFELPGLDPGQPQQVVGQPREPHRVLADDLEEALLLRGALEVALQQGLGEPADRGQRRLQLVGEVRDEVAADPFERVESRDIHEDEHRSRRCGRRGPPGALVGGANGRAAGQDLAPAERDRTLGGAASHRGRDHLQKAFLLEHLPGLAALVVAPRVAGKRHRGTERPVQILDAQAPVEDRDPLPHAREDRGALVLLRGQRLEAVSERERGPVQRGEQLVEFRHPERRGLGSEVAAGDPFRELAEAGDPLREARREPEGQPRGDRRGDQDGERDRRQDRADGLLESDDRLGEPQHGVRAPGRTDRHIGEFLAARLAEALRAAVGR